MKGGKLNYIAEKIKNRVYGIVFVLTTKKYRDKIRL